MLARLAAVASALLMAAAASGDETRSGEVEISQTQVSFIVSGSVGGGTLTYKGRRHDFSIGGVGAARIEARGEVYNLKRLEDFEGPYALARAGAVAGGEQVDAGLWLINDKGVEMRLTSRREGYALSLGGDAVYVRFD